MQCSCNILLRAHDRNMAICQHCGQWFSCVARDAAEPNSAVPTQSTEPNWMALVEKIVPLLTQSSSTTAILQMSHAIAAMTQTAMADIPQSRPVLDLMIAHLGKLLLDAETLETETHAH